MIECEPGTVDVWQFRDALLDRPIHSAKQVLARVLSVYLGCDPDNVPLARGVHGKPRLSTAVSAGDLRFNASHSGGAIAVAVTVGREVGIDLQADLPDDRLEGLVHYYTPGEQSLITAAPGGPRRVELIRRLWVAKEALVKATGEGVTTAFRRLDLSASGGGTFTVRRPLVGEDVPRVWTVQPLVLPLLPYPAALAIEGAEPADIVLRNWSPDPVG